MRATNFIYVSMQRRLHEIKVTGEDTGTHSKYPSFVDVGCCGNDWNTVVAYQRKIITFSMDKQTFRQKYLLKL